jgi:NAD-dependent deacetylase
MTDKPGAESETLAGCFARASRILVITGAGVSAESGIPTFRGAGGWYRQQRAEDLASLPGFQRNPALVWEWYDYRRQLIAKAEPNAAHRAIADWQATKEVVVVTQNVDDLHERAGTRAAVHVHGSIWRVKCMNGCGVSEDRRVPMPELPPKCEKCGALLRPDVVWFGEMLPTAELARVEQQMEQPFDIAFIVGTEAVFGYIQEWAVRAQRAGALLVEVNPAQTVLSPYADVRLEGAAGTALRNLEPVW